MVILSSTTNQIAYNRFISIRFIHIFKTWLAFIFVARNSTHFVQSFNYKTHESRRIPLLLDRSIFSYWNLSISFFETATKFHGYLKSHIIKGSQKKHFSLKYSDCYLLMILTISRLTVAICTYKIIFHYSRYLNS